MLLWRLVWLWALRLNHLPKTPDLEVKYEYALDLRPPPRMLKSWQSWRLSLESPNWFKGSCHPGGDEPAFWVAGMFGSIQKEITSQSTILSQWDMGGWLARGFKPGGTMMIFSVSLVGFQPPKPDEQGGSSPLKAERNLMKFDLPGHAKTPMTIRKPANELTAVDWKIGNGLSDYPPGN